ncbi:protein-tyrosine phosphatase [Rubritalea squalenifaciens DSM 18772]|uniref:Protein-tyrosine phosphatase n=1 Tax=Rubritalea squalenifaciens DSM 18772 TaxID=1123071 RepID=A0A1M6PTX0_9BACT|nr:low molecular weight protein-tyrosine-phosphatase [Rubritalea squalenifaciens]SHK11330.1 protein-tyrosine phosphatase [Rubritalea squalenifaciens DSM 18772]
MEPTRVLFVCLGNICRSPAGENIFRHAVKQADREDDFVIDSAGTAGWHTGKKPDSRMSATLRSRDIPVAGRARQIQLEDLIEFDLIITMDDENYTNVLKLDRSGQYHGKVRKLTSFCTERDLSEVPDPYYGGQDGFELVADLILDAAENILLEY